MAAFSQLPESRSKFCDLLYIVEGKPIYDVLGPGPAGPFFLKMFTNCRVQRVAATMLKDDRKKVFDTAKSAVNAYAKDPSDKNAASAVITSSGTVGFIRLVSACGTRSGESFPWCA